VLGLRLRGRHALFPPKGEEKEEVKPARHADGEDYLTRRARTRDDAPLMTREPPQFRVTAERLGSAGLVAVEGELDIATLPEVEQTLTRMRSDQLERLVIDLREVAFLDSTSIELLLRLHGELTAAGAELVIVRAPRDVDRIFDLMELGRVLNLVDEPPDLTPSGE
jgi:anti-sigma B factor antagonist